MSAVVAQLEDWKERLAGAMEFMAGCEQVQMPLRHYFLPGIYIREIFMPAGTFVIGKIHKTEHFNIILKGRVSLVSPDGTTTVDGPLTFVSKPGVQKALYIHEDTTWQTVHLTDLKDLEALEAQLIEPDASYPAFDRTAERAAIAAAAQPLLEYAI